ncbi:uncharacterized protein LOC131639623 [Vicia villosa]|uniref:uncharacterized protein LOC131639623 n=1 Tax=Vicia villosa TaxID=3911 RepID=UPI00273B80CF|nr:uncharacterized protein LOC131639623 [Vicia villosa]
MRGGGSSAKRKRVGNFIRKGEVDISFIQKTKLGSIDKGLVCKLWEDSLVDWSYAKADRASGGLLTMWKKDYFNLVFSFKDQGYLGLCVEKNGKLIYFVNIYASCDINRRMESWKRLMEFKLKNDKGAWCIGGDFNSISSLEEKVGKSGRSSKREMSVFNAFIEGMDLVDLPTIGGKFTWFNSNGQAMSRIDRFLLSEDFIEDWKVNSLELETSRIMHRFG